MGKYTNYQYFQYIDKTARMYLPHKNQIQETYEDGGSGNHHYVMWSGGTDSTLLLYELLATYGADRVHAISYKYPWLYAPKYETEKVFREAFVDRMKQLGPHFSPFDYNELNIAANNFSGHPLNACYGNRAGYPQAVGWLLSAMQFIPDNSFVYTGAIRDDELIVKMEEYHNMFMGVAGVLGKYLTLREPYLYLRKHEIIEKLMEYELYDLTWFCENPPNGPMTKCYNCAPCLLHMQSLMTIANDFSTKSNQTLKCVKMKAKSVLIQMEKEREEENKKKEEVTVSPNDSNIKESKLLNYIKDMYKNKKFNIAYSMSEYERNTQYSCLLYKPYESLCFQGNVIDEMIQKITPNRERINVIKELKATGALRTVGDGKNTLKIKHSSGTMRFYCIKLSYLEDN